ncbi:MAG: GldG family protein [bacterium]|nr:GldG family protein [bacterium]
MKSLLVRLGLFLLVVAFGVGQFGGCSCIPSCTPIPKVVLIDDAHQNENNFDGYGFDAFYTKLVTTLQGMGYTVNKASTAGFNPSISVYGVVILPAPSQAYSSTEKQAIVDFVKAGGKLLMFGEWGAFATANTNLNTISTALGAGITFNNNTVYDDTNNHDNRNYWPLIQNFVSHSTTSGLTTLAYIVGCSLTVQSPGTAIAYASSSAYTVSSLSRELAGNSAGIGVKVPETKDKVTSIIVAAVAQIGSGKVAVIGDTNIFGNDVYENETDFIDLYNNKKFLQNIINW